MIGAISEQTYLQRLTAHTAAGTSPITSGAANMALAPGFDSVRLFTAFGTAASNNVIKAQQSSDDGSADAYSDIAGSQVSSGTSDEICFIDIIRPTKQYLKLIATPGTSSTVETIYAEFYNARTEPVDNTVSGSINGVVLTSPAEGTA